MFMASSKAELTISLLLIGGGLFRVAAERYRKIHLDKTTSA